MSSILKRYGNKVLQFYYEVSNGSNYKHPEIGPYIIVKSLDFDQNSRSRCRRMRVCVYSVKS